MRRRPSTHPRSPFGRDDLNHVGQVLAPRLRTLGDRDVTEPTRLVHGVLHHGPTDAREGSNLVDGQIADAVMFDFPCYDAQHGALAFGVMMPKMMREHGRSAEHPASVPRCLTILGALRAPGNEPTPEPTPQPSDEPSQGPTWAAHAAVRRSMEGYRAAPINCVGQVNRLGVVKLTFAPTVPDSRGDGFEDIGRRSGVDALIDKRSAGREGDERAARRWRVL